MATFMPGHNCCHVWHTVVAHFDVEFVADFVQSVMARNVFSEQSQEFLADVGFNMLAKRWVKPRDVSFPLLFLEPRISAYSSLTVCSMHCSSMHNLYVI